MKKSALIIILFCFGCKSIPKPPAVHISPVNNNRSIKFTGLDYAIMGEISRDSVADIWENLLPVYRMPADTGLKDYQPIQHGLYQLKDSAIVFTPDTPFIKGQTYFIRYYQFGGGNNIWDLIKSKKRLGSMHYIDLVFLVR
jgi:hypothetical protein